MKVKQKSLNLNIFNQICRVCMCQENDLTSIFTKLKYLPTTCSTMIMTISSFKIKRGDGLPEMICRKCIDKSYHAYILKKDLEKSEKMLRQILSENSDNIAKIPTKREKPVQQINEISQDDYVEDISDNREEDSKVECTICHRSLASTYIKRHYLKHEKQQLRETKTEEYVAIKDEMLVNCKLCDYVFTSESILKRHISARHTRKENKLLLESNTLETYICSACNKGFTEVVAFEDHMKTHLEFQCDICHKIFKSKSNLLLHTRTHADGKSFICTVCDEVFDQLSNLKLHAATHSEVKVHLCVVCGKQFGGAGTLKMHVQTHTGERPHLCEDCGKGFVNPKDLKMHNRLHTGERPYKCTFCDKRWNSITHLNSHMRTHTGEKPFKCDLCNNSFALAATLKKHLLIHSRKKPYTCCTCGKGFTQVGTLVIHLKTHKK